VATPPPSPSASGLHASARCSWATRAKRILQPLSGTPQHDARVRSVHRRASHDSLGSKASDPHTPPSILFPAHQVFVTGAGGRAGRGRRGCSLQSCAASWAGQGCRGDPIHLPLRVHGTPSPCARAKEAERHFFFSGLPPFPSPLSFDPPLASPLLRQPQQDTRPATLQPQLKSRHADATHISSTLTRLPPQQAWN
jgi:hypothetical protein